MQDVVMCKFFAIAMNFVATGDHSWEIFHAYEAARGANGQSLSEEFYDHIHQQQQRE